MEPASVENMRLQFDVCLNATIATKAFNSVFISREKYARLLNEVSELRSKTRNRTPGDYRNMKRYDKRTVDGVEKLVTPTADPSAMRLFAATDELFDIIHECHLAVDHGGRNRTAEEIRKKYKNVTTETIMTYLGLCEVCREKSGTVREEADPPAPFDDSVRFPTPAVSFVDRKRRIAYDENPRSSFEEPLPDYKSDYRDDEYDILGKYYANELRKMSERQRLFGKKLISDIIFYGHMGNLNEKTRIEISRQNCIKVENDDRHDDG